ncbi:hypothetical protein CHS0354_003995 [Potamilus streckersoni]|uniref:Uncharacterized protein n=1 Tax=Potamilus streckersoni TaxID=2493646 RepID=A0AAE0VMG6_9BIVA|nr:hypothetical protein CHS0354_003995 [Potamilus streckersoni]
MLVDMKNNHLVSSSQQSADMHSNYPLGSNWLRPKSGSSIRDMYRQIVTLYRQHDKDFYTILDMGSLY